MIGELIPNRVFVSGLPLTVSNPRMIIFQNLKKKYLIVNQLIKTSEIELKEFFSNLIGTSNVQEVEIIMDFKGVSKG